MTTPTVPIYELRIYRTPASGWKLRVLSLTQEIVKPKQGKTEKRLRRVLHHRALFPSDEHARTPYVRHLGHLDEFEVIAFCGKEDMPQVKEAVIDLFETHVGQVLKGLRLPVASTPERKEADQKALHEICIQNDFRGGVVKQKIVARRIQKREKECIFYREDDEKQRILHEKFLGLPPTWGYRKGVRLTAWTDSVEEIDPLREALLREYEAYKERMLEELGRATKDVERLRTEEPTIGIF